MVEWSKAPHWKCGVLQGTEGSNPSLSAILKNHSPSGEFFLSWLRSRSWQKASLFAALFSKSPDPSRRAQWASFRKLAHITLPRVAHPFGVRSASLRSLSNPSLSAAASAEADLSAILKNHSPSGEFFLSWLRSRSWQKALLFAALFAKSPVKRGTLCVVSFLGEGESFRHLRNDALTDRFRCGWRREIADG